jgi:hypothetical protein
MKRSRYTHTENRFHAGCSVCGLLGAAPTERQAEYISAHHDPECEGETNVFDTMAHKGIEPVRVIFPMIQRKAIRELMGKGRRMR